MLNSKQLKAFGSLGVVLVLAAAGCGAPSDAHQPAVSAGSAAASSSGGTSAQTTTSLPGSKASFSGTNFPITVTDWAGTKTTFTKKPERTVLATGSALNLWYDAGGTAVGATTRTSSNKLKPEIAAELDKLPEVGRSRTIDTEKLISLNPDLVMTAAHSQEKLVDSMRQMGVNTISMTLTTINDLQMAYEMLGALNGTHDQAKAKFDKIKADTAAVIAKAPKDKKTKVAIVNVNPNGLTVKTVDSVAGDMAKQLGLENVVTAAGPANSEEAPLDVEYLAKVQPDVILVTSHVGSNDIARKRLEESFSSNSAWQAVDAVRNGKVKFLPQEYFLLHPGPFYADAIGIMAASVYPEIYGEPKIS